METLVALPLPVLLLAVALLGSLTVGQTMHVFWVSARTELRLQPAMVLYECLILTHLLLGTAIAVAASHHWSTFVLRLFGLWVPLEPLLWGNAVAAGMAVALGVVLRRPILLMEAVLLFAWTPAGMGIVGESVPILGLISLAYLTYRVIGDLALDVWRQSREISRFSVTEAIMRLPEGVLLADPSGGIWLMNDAMRFCLVSLGFPTDLADTRGLWAALQRKAIDEPDGLLPEGVVLTVNEDETRFFTVDAVTLRGRECQRIMAFDVTDEHRLNSRLSRTNDLLARTAQELRGALARVSEAARNEALLNARSRVHDVIGQRLSILHRYLEDDEITDESLARMEPILSEILSDLTAVERTDPTAELNAIVAAFALIDVRVEVTGELPDDPQLADTLVQIVREATTNAVKHGQAGDVAVVVEKDSSGVRLSISDGPPAPGQNLAERHVMRPIFSDNQPSATTQLLREGLGLPGMRRAAEALGGTLEVLHSDPFTIIVTIPQPDDDLNPRLTEGAFA